MSSITCYHKDGNHRYLCAPFCLLYVNKNQEHMPIAIQLEQELGKDNPLWTPIDGEGWLLAKLWVRCVDFHYQMMISHILKSQFIIEPFYIAMCRQLSSSHPVYKLLKPHLK
jgi:hypothetical protein